MARKHPLFTIGFTKKSAEQFFDIVEKHDIEILIDVRASNTSQLAGFTKREDLNYFLDRILGVDYRHLEFLAPTPEIRATLKHPEQGWPEYERRFVHHLRATNVLGRLDRDLFLRNVCCLLCSEPTAEHCHRRLVAEHLASAWPELEIHHL